MSFHSGKFAQELSRASERKSLDSLDVDRVFVVARELRRYVRAWNVFDEAIVRIARGIVERRVSPVRVAEIIEATMIRLRLPAGHKHRPRNPGAYFMVSVKKEFERAGFPWKSGEE
ncbi:MAG: hypothetical protein U0805_20935 [Pirellulales bacterium]